MTQPLDGEAPSGSDRHTMPLAAALRMAAEVSAHEQPPAAVAQAAMAALRQRAAQRLPLPAQPTTTAGAQRHGLHAWAFSGAGAALAAVGGVVVLWVGLAGAPTKLAPQQIALEASDFVPLLPPAAWPADTAGRASPAYLVRTEMPSERLAALGLPFDPARAGERRPAELLVHPSGEVLAVRLVP